MKRCWDCKIYKELISFGKYRKEKDGLRRQCKECRNRKLRTGKPNLGRYQKGHVAKKPFVKGHKSGMFGKKHSEETKAKLSEKRKGIVRNPFLRMNVKARDWARKVKDRDGWVCQRCPNKEKLNAHHIVPWKKDESLRYELSNGLTLCDSCHAKEEGFQKGHGFTEEMKLKISVKKKGSIPWNKGLKR